MTASSRFFRIATDRTRSCVALDGLFSGPQPSACWLIGGGPSLSSLPHAEIRDSPLPKMCVNLAGTGLLRPTFWTAYDPPVRFHRSVFLDPGVMKLLTAERAFDLVPETTFKICECPNTAFFDRDSRRSYHDLFAATSQGVVDWRDSFVQAIDVLYRLGFRIIYLAGCEMWVQPSNEQIARAEAVGVRYERFERLREFLQRCEHAGLPTEQLDAMPPGPHYHFAEWKPIRAAANTDEHYHRIVQMLRLSRRSISNAGLQLISVTPHSRLNDFFPYKPPRQVLNDIRNSVGDPQSEPVKGLYRGAVDRSVRLLCPMRDVMPPASSHPSATVDRPLFIPQMGRDDPEILAECEGFVALNRRRQDIAQMQHNTPPICEDG